MYCAIVLIYYSHVLNKVSCYTVLEESCCNTLQYFDFQSVFKVNLVAFIYRTITQGLRENPYETIS